MIREAQRQTLWQSDSSYESQKEITVTYSLPKVDYKLSLKGTLDRFSLEKGLIRDFKTTNKLDSFAYDLSSKYGYDFQMAFYYTLVHAAHDVQCDMILDVVQTTYPYPSKVFGYPKSRLEIISV